MILVCSFLAPLQAIQECNKGKELGHLGGFWTKLGKLRPDLHYFAAAEKRLYWLEVLSRGQTKPQMAQKAAQYLPALKKRGIEILFNASKPGKLPNFIDLKTVLLNLGVGLN